MKKSIIVYFIALIVFVTGCGTENIDITTQVDQSESVTSSEAVNSEIANEELNVLSLGATTPFAKSREAHSLIYDSMTRLDNDARALPNLITEWKSNEDHTQYKLVLQEGITFHDGTPLTSEIVKWNIENGGEINYLSYSFVLESVIIEDNLNLTVNFMSPYLYFDKDMAMLACLPIDGYTDEGHYASNIGTGPYIFEGTDEGDVTTLNKNTAYWNSEYDNQVDQIIWYSIPDEQTRKMALESGKVNALGLSEHYISLSYGTIYELLEMPDYQITKEADDAYTSVLTVAANWKSGRLTDVNLRKALTYMIDRDTIVETLFFNIPKSVSHIYNPKFDDGPQKQAPYTYDIEKAKDYLALAGYTLGDDHTPTMDSDGNSLELKLVCGNEDYEKDLIVYLESEFKKMGIKLDIHSLEGTAKYDTLSAGDYDLLVAHSWFTPLIDTLGYMGFETEHTNYGLGFCINDDMMNAAMGYSGAANTEEAAQYSDDIWQIQYDNASFTPILADIRYIIDDGKFVGFTFNPNVFQMDLNGVKVK